MKNNIIKAGVIGDPISHSLSPHIHNFFLNKYQINGSYEKIFIAKNQLEQGVKNLINQGFKGFNVTIPHKEAMFELCQETTDIAKLTRAVNTILIKDENRLFGDNSDGFGFIKNLEYQYPKFHLNQKNCFIIGAGGAARSIIYSLIIKKVNKIFITNRNKIRAEDLINDFQNLALKNNCELIIVDKQDFQENLGICDLLINTTSLGMIGFEPLNLNISKIKIDAIVSDIIYKPLITNLLQQAKTNNIAILTGIGMLINQALIGFRMWFDHIAEFDENLNNQLISINYE